MFTKYNSIENSYRTKAFEEAFDHPEASSTDWSVTEKLDGTNFSIVVTKDSVQPAKRSGLIHENEKFFGYQDMYEPLKDKARDLYISVSRKLGFQPEVVQIYGEYVGKGILNRVDYKEKGFYVFDIRVGSEYLNAEYVDILVSDAGFDPVPTFFVGTAEEVKDWHDKWLEKDFLFNSTITLDATHGLLDSEPTTLHNVAEGFVIKPDKALYATSGSRIILKCKSSKFKEKKSSGSEQKKHLDLSEKDAEVVNKLLELITESRVYSVVSKIGGVTTKDFGKVLKDMVADVKEDFEKEQQTELHLISDSIASIIQTLNKECSIEIRKHWLNIIDTNEV